MTALAVLTVLLLGIGVAFHLVASIAMFRLPDVYTRLHALSKADALGTLVALAGIAAWEGASLTTVKVALIAAFFFLTSPAAAHAVARAAFRTGLAPWRASGGDTP